MDYGARLMSVTVWCAAVVGWVWSRLMSVYALQDSAGYGACLVSVTVWCATGVGWV